LFALAFTNPTNSRGYATMLLPSVCLSRYLLWLNGAS